MVRTKFQRVLAFALALTFVLGCALGVHGAETDTGSVTNTDIGDIKALLNAISYSDYLKHTEDVESAEKEIVIDATKGYTYVARDGEVFTDSTDVGDRFVEGKNQSFAYVAKFDGKDGLYVPGNGTVSWTTDLVKTAAKYNIVIEYYPIANKSASIERIFLINGETPFKEARYLTISKVWKNAYPDGEFKVPEGENGADYVAKATAVGISARVESREDGEYVMYVMPEVWTEDVSNIIDDQLLRFFTVDIDDNEIRGSLEQKPEWTEYYFKDANGFFAEPFEFVIDPKNDDEEIVPIELSLQSVNEPIVISSIRLEPVEDVPSYEEYSAKYAGVAEGKGKVKIEGEYFYSTSTQTIYPIEDRTNPMNSPSSTKHTVLNSVGGAKWQIAGQKITYKFQVSESGMYQITTRFKQEVLEGMYTSRILYLYSDETVAKGEKGYYDGVPFTEATNIRFPYDDEWQSCALGDGSTEFKFYFEKGVTYTMSLEVSLGEMGSIVNRVQASLDSINNDYLNVLKLTGANPDEYRDYGFNRVLPDVMIDFIRQSQELYSVAAEIETITGEASSMTATLEKVAWLLDKMGKDEDEVAKNLEQLKNYIGTLGTWVGDAKTQPLQIDYYSVQPASEALPVAKAGFWKALWHEITSFFQSFFRNYNRMGATEMVTSDDAVEVWLAYGRDQSQVIRNLINNDFTPKTGVAVDLKLVAGGTLLPSILSGMGPDVYIGLGQGDVINYAIRGALINVEHQAGFEDVKQNFNEAAMIVLEIEDAEGVMHTYGLPETQNFPMMFVRKDVLADLGIDIPKTWDDVLESIPVLQANNMQIGMTNDYRLHLYQNGGALYADGGMRINLDSNMALEAFDTTCSFYTMYSFPYIYNFANRFRTGEMPIGFGDYVVTYNQLKVFATEIEGLWGFYPMPGYADEEGNINNASVSVVTAIVMVTDCKNEENAWEYMKWYVGEDCQTNYANEMVAIIGPSAKQATANVNALESLPWTTEEYEQLALQFNNLASIPNYPGSYIIDRYTGFAFLAAYNDSADPVEELQGYITTINKEITRKREEFGLETLELGQTLAEKRMLQAEEALEAAKESSGFKAQYEFSVDHAIKIMNKGETDDFVALGAMADELLELDSELFGTAVKYMRDAVDALKSYEIYK